MKLKLSPLGKLYKITWQGPQGAVSTNVLARNEIEAENTFRYEYQAEYSRELQMSVQQLTPNDKNDSWKWYEFQFRKGGRNSLLVASSLFI